MKTIENEQLKSKFNFANFTIKTFLVLAALAIFASCSKEGPVGLAGTTGAAGINGINGTNGTNGTNGNANVQQYTFGTRTIIDEISFTIPNFTQAQLDNSVVLFYHKDSVCGDYWYSSPGFGCSSSYITRLYTRTAIGNLFVNVVLLLPNGMNNNISRTFTASRVIIIPTTSNTPLARNSSITDYSKMSYSEVCKILNIKE